VPSPTPSNIYPSLSYEDAPAAIEWLCRAFGFEKRLVVPMPNGIRHSELSFGTSVIMVSSVRPGIARVSPRALNGVVNQALCVCVDDADAHYARAKAAGAEITEELYNSDFGSRGYSAKDLEGNHWHFGTYRPGTYWP